MAAKLTASPWLKVEPSAGAVRVTTGGVLSIVRVIWSEPARAPESVTWAVITWLPIDKLAENEPPEPISPSRSENHRRPVVTSPSSRSLAVPAKAMVSAATKVAPSVGALIDTLGGVLASSIVRLRKA